MARVCNVLFGLLLIDTLSAVGSLIISLQDTFTFLTWSAPFTLDISANAVDITYCVDVANLTAVLYSECGIITNRFNYSIPSGGECGEVVFTVIPVNAAGRGMPNTIEYSLALHRKLLSYAML